MRSSSLSAKPTSLVLRPGPERAVCEAGEERYAGDEEPVGDRHVDVAGTFFGRVRYPLRDLLWRNAFRAPPALLVPGASGVLPEGRAGRARIDAGDGDTTVGYL